MYYGIRVFWNLVAVGGAIAVGLLTHDAGLIAITFLGGLIAPRILGLAPRGRRGWRGFGFGPGACMAGGRWRGERFEAWHHEAPGRQHPTQPTGTTVV